MFLAAIFFCQIVFGIYGMVLDARKRRQRTGKGSPMPELPELNPVIHGKLRLALLSLLSGVEEAEFTWLRAKTGSTDGNLGAQLLKLEEAGYVAVEKKFVQRKPQTLYRMTEAGRAGAHRVRAGAEATAGRGNRRVKLASHSARLACKALPHALHDAQVIGQVVDRVQRCRRALRPPASGGAGRRGSSGGRPCSRRPGRAGPWSSA